VNDNIVDVTIGPGAAEAAPVVFKSSPATSYVTFLNRATTGKPDSEPEIRWSGDARFSTYDPLNRRLLITGKGLAGYLMTRSGEHLAFAIYVNNVSVPTERDAVKTHHRTSARRDCRGSLLKTK